MIKFRDTKIYRGIKKIFKIVTINYKKIKNIILD